MAMATAADNDDNKVDGDGTMMSTVQLATGFDDDGDGNGCGQ